MNTSVHTLLLETWVFDKTMVLAMFEDEQSVLAEHFLSKNQVGQFGQSCQGIWGIGKDKVEGVVTLLYIAEHIGSQGNPVGFVQLLLHLIYKGVVRRFTFYGYHSIAAARDELETDASRTGKEIQHIGALIEVDKVGKHIEQVLLGKVRCGACLERTRHIECAALIFSTDYSHEMRVWRSKGIPSMRANSVEWNSSAGRI